MYDERHVYDEEDDEETGPIGPVGEDQCSDPRAIYIKGGPNEIVIEDCRVVWLDEEGYASVVP